MPVIISFCENCHFNWESMFNTLDEMRKQLMLIDHELIQLLSERQRVSQAIGQFKQQHQITVEQLDYWTEMCDLRAEKAVSSGVDAALITPIFELIHGYSIAIQKKEHGTDNGIDGTRRIL